MTDKVERPERPTLDNSENWMTWRAKANAYMDHLERELEKARGVSDPDVLNIVKRVTADREAGGGPTAYDVIQLAEYACRLEAQLATLTADAEKAQENFARAACAQLIGVYAEEFIPEGCTVEEAINYAVADVRRAVRATRPTPKAGAGGEIRQDISEELLDEYGF